MKGNIGNWSSLMHGRRGYAAGHSSVAEWLEVLATGYVEGRWIQISPVLGHVMCKSFSGYTPNHDLMRALTHSTSELRYCYGTAALLHQVPSMCKNCGLRSVAAW